MKGLVSGFFIGIAFKLSPVFNFDEPLLMGILVGLFLGKIVDVILDSQKRGGKN